MLAAAESTLIALDYARHAVERYVKAYSRGLATYDLAPLDPAARYIRTVEQAADNPTFDFPEDAEVLDALVRMALSFASDQIHLLRTLRCDD